MALIACKECGKEISDQACSCPHCGIDIRSPNDTPTHSSKNADEASSARRDSQGFAIANLIFAGIVLLLMFAAPVLRSGYSSRDIYKWTDLYETRRHYYNGFNRWQLEFSSRYESESEQQMPRIMGYAMPIVLFAWLILSLVGLFFRMPCMSFTFRGKLHSVSFLALPPLLACGILFYFVGDTQSVLRGMMRMGGSGRFMPAYWGMFALCLVILASSLFSFVVGKPVSNSKGAE